jgi:hypothetical protein
VAVAEVAPVVVVVVADVVVGDVAGSTPHIIGEVRADVGAEMDNGVAANDDDDDELLDE